MLFQDCFQIPKNVFGKIFGFWEEKSRFGEHFGESVKYITKVEGVMMRKKNYKGRCEKRTLSKCKEVCRTYDRIQFAYADYIQQNECIAEIQCNVSLDGEEYTTDFVCVKTDQELMVRECISRRLLTKPMTVKLLDQSREYWLRRGVSDWGIVIDEE